MNKKRSMALLLALCVMPTVVYAAEASIPTYDLGEVLVLGDRPKDNVSTEEINVKYVSPGKYSTVPDLLKYSAGIDVRQRSAYGDNQNDTVKVRGLDSNRYNVMLDGQPIKMSGVMGGNFINWNSIPLDMIERINITKGGKLASSPNIGGTIDIITKKDTTGGSVTLLAGEQGRYEYRVNYGFNAGKLNTFVSAGKYGIDGYLLNNDYDAQQYNIKLGYKFSDADELRLGYGKTKGERGYVIANKPGVNGYDPSYPTTNGDGLVMPQPGPIGQANNYGRGSYWKKDTDHYDLSYKHNFNDGSLQFDYYRNYEERREVLKNRSGVTQLDRVIPSDKTDYFGIKGETLLNELHHLGYGAELQRMRYGYGHYNIKPNFAGSLYPSQKIDNTGIYVEDNWKMDDRWGLYMGLRYDHYKAGKDDSSADTMLDQDESGLSPKFTLTLKSDPKNTSYVSANRVWRAPSMPEYYWWSQNYSTGTYTNGLTPEKGMSYEIGHTHKFDERYTTKADVFYQDIDDYINFRHYSPFYAHNVDNAKIKGFELEQSIKFDAKNALYLNYTNQTTHKSGVNGGAADINNGLLDELDYSPRHKIGLSYVYDDELWKVRYGLNYVSKQKEAPVASGGEIFHIGGYAVHNLAVTRTINKDLDISLFVDNIFDKDYVEQYGYPMSGRLFSAALTYRF